MESRKILLTAAVLIFTMILIVVPHKPSHVKAMNKGEAFSAFAFLPQAASVRANLTIFVESYTPDAEAQQYAAMLLKEGPNVLLKALEKAPAIGKVEREGHVGFFDLKLIRSRPTESGRRVVGVCDRPIGFLEAYNAGRSLDNRFGILIMDLTRKGEDKEEGEGQLIYAAKIKVLEGNKIEVENYGIDPLRLLGVRKF